MVVPLLLKVEGKNGFCSYFFGRKKKWKNEKLIINVNAFCEEFESPNQTPIATMHTHLTLMIVCSS